MPKRMKKQDGEELPPLVSDGERACRGMPLMLASRTSSMRSYVHEEACACVANVHARRGVPLCDPLNQLLSSPKQQTDEEPPPLIDGESDDKDGDDESDKPTPLIDDDEEEVGVWMDVLGAVAEPEGRPIAQHVRRMCHSQLCAPQQAHLLNATTCAQTRMRMRVRAKSSSAQSYWSRFAIPLPCECTLLVPCAAQEDDGPPPLLSDEGSNGSLSDEGSDNPPDL
eukprot:scaffold12148_cov18-Tisochrysis_lutea.AAC.1